MVEHITRNGRQDFRRGDHFSFIGRSWGVILMEGLYFKIKAYTPIEKYILYKTIPIHQDDIGIVYAEPLPGFLVRTTKPAISNVEDPSQGLLIHPGRYKGEKANYDVMSLALDPNNLQDPNQDFVMWKSPSQRILVVSRLRHLRLCNTNCKRDQRRFNLLEQKGSTLSFLSP